VDRHGRLGSIGAARRGPSARLSDNAVRDMVVRRARAAKLPNPRGGRFSTAHSTRTGFATQAAAKGAHERGILDPRPVEVLARCPRLHPPRQCLHRQRRRQARTVGRGSQRFWRPGSTLLEPTVTLPLGQWDGAGGWRSSWPLPHEEVDVTGHHFSMVGEHALATAAAVHTWLAGSHEPPSALNTTHLPADPSGEALVR
jgi:hypothetical protein